MGISQVDKNKSCLKGCWMEVGCLVPLLAVCGVHSCQEFKESLLLNSVSPVVRATWAGLKVSLLDERGLWPAN